MGGPEVQANAIWTAMHDLPLRDAPGWLGVVLVLALAGLPRSPAGAVVRSARRSPRRRPRWRYVLAAQWAFDRGTVLPVTPPLIALAIAHRRRVPGQLRAPSSAGAVASASTTPALEAAVATRTHELRATQLEVVRRLGQAAESRDGDTGAHIERMSRLCERVALAMGLAPGHAERIRHAALLHDVGKIGIPDRILNKPGALRRGRPRGDGDATPSSGPRSSRTRESRSSSSPSASR